MTPLILLGTNYHFSQFTHSSITSNYLYFLFSWLIHRKQPHLCDSSTCSFPENGMILNIYWYNFPTPSQNGPLVLLGIFYIILGLCFSSLQSQVIYTLWSIFLQKFGIWCVFLSPLHFLVLTSIVTHLHQCFLHIIKYMLHLFVRH